jgi:hypothetical protein
MPMEPGQDHIQDGASADDGGSKAGHRLVRTSALLITWSVAAVVIALLTVVEALFLYVAAVPWEWVGTDPARSGVRPGCRQPVRLHQIQVEVGTALCNPVRPDLRLVCAHPRVDRPRLAP